MYLLSDPSSFSSSSKALAPSSPSSGVGGEREGWDFDDTEWGSFDTTGPSTRAAGSAGTGSSSSARQELQQKRREERKLKQQAAREKRAAGMSLKPGLGAIKKD